MKTLVQPPQQLFSGLVAFVSPVSSKKNVLNFEPGWNRPFSGRLNGVPSFECAAAFASKGAVPSTAVSWIVTHFVAKTLPYVCRASWSDDESARLRRLGDRLAERVLDLQDLELAVGEVAGLGRDVAVDVAVRDACARVGAALTHDATGRGLFAPPMSSTIQMFPSESFWMPS